MVLDPLCSCSSCCSKDKKNRLCGSLIPDLRGDRYQPASQKYSGKTKAFCGNRSSHPYDHQTEGFLFSVRSHHSILCRCSGNAPYASEEIRNPGSSSGSTGGIFQTVSWCPLSDRCSDRIRDRAGGKYVVSMDRANETGRQTGTLALSIGNMKHFTWTKY